MLKNKFTEQEKKIAELYREYDRLRSATREYPLVELIEPYQKGWTRDFVLREDATNRKDADVLEKILDRLNYSRYSDNKEFLMGGRFSRNNERKPIEQPIKTLSEKEYEELSEQEKSWFHMREVYKPWGNYKEYVFKAPHYLEFNVQPRMITHKVIPDQQIESRLGEIREHIDRHNLWPKIGKIEGWKRSRRDDYELRKSRLLGHMQDEELLHVDYEPEEPAADEKEEITRGFQF